MNNQQKQQVLEQVKSANNVLVTVSANPTVDELAASVGFTLALNKLGKHATTVFSGVVPSTIEFLQPEDTIETTTDSLRDFIIALDKSKADKLRYKVEDDVVRIFITPYKTTITDKDLEFSHGDFNVDVVVAIGVTRREDLDKAVTAHGRILHDAVVISITRDGNSELGSMNWQEPQASSLCEMVGALTTELGQEVLDGQMATAFLTGIIAETDRFKNEKTTPAALGLSSQLMSSGANQQLIAEKLEEPQGPPLPLHKQDEDGGEQNDEGADDGTLSIDHKEESDEEEVDKIHIDEHGNIGEHPDDDASKDWQDKGDEPYNPPVEPPKEKWGEPSGEEKPTLPEPEHTNQVLTHEKKVIIPPSEAGQDKTDKPFDLNAAIQAAKDDGIPVEAAPIEPEEQAEPEAELQLPPQTPSEPPKIIQEHSGPMLAEPPRTDAQENLVSTEQDEVPSGSPHPAPHEAAEHQVDDTPAPTPADDTPEEAPSSVPPAPIVDTPPPAPAMPPQPDSSDTNEDDQTLTQLEQAVDSPHVDTSSIDDARAAVANAADAQPLIAPIPQQSVGAQNVDLQKVADEVAQTQPEVIQNDMPEVHDPTAPPPVPPPMSSPQFYDADGNNQNPFSN